MQAGWRGGGELAQLDAPDLRAQGNRNLARAEADRPNDRPAGAGAGLDQASDMTDRLGEQLAEVQATGDELGRLNLRAEFAGFWLDVDPLRRGTWVNPREPLGILSIRDIGRSTLLLARPKSSD